MNSRCLLLKGKDYFPVRTMFGEKNAAASVPDSGDAFHSRRQTFIGQRIESVCAP